MIIKILNGLKIIRRKLTLKQAITIVTSQALSILYYASRAWLTPSLGRKEMDAVETLSISRPCKLSCETTGKG